MIYYGQPTEDYFRTEALSASGIKLLLQSPAHYKYGPPFTSKSMDLGTAIHSAVLEPEEFEKIYVPYEGDGRLKATKDKIKEIKENKQTAIKQSDYETVEGVLKSIESHDKASRLLDLPGHNEVLF